MIYVSCLSMNIRNLVGRVLNMVCLRPNHIIYPPLPDVTAWICLRFFPKWYNERRCLNLNRLVTKVKQNYTRAIEKCRRKLLKGEKLRVLFIVKQQAKWKTDSLFRLMLNDDRFQPIIAITTPSSIIGRTPNEIMSDLHTTYAWFEKKGYPCVLIYKPKSNCYLRLSKFDPDIVFYPEAWYDIPVHSPEIVSKFALTCYVPYFVPNYTVVEVDCQLEVHRLYWRHFVLNENLAETYRKATLDRTMAGEFIPVGHTMLDELHTVAIDEQNASRKIIIYAPHWTVSNDEHATRFHYATFMKNGLEILQYARMHREFDWVFKPHPSLSLQLVESKLMTREEVAEYYNSWREIGSVYDDGGYMDLFLHSYAMITDCGSFLSEYGATGKPIIHLISARNDIVPIPSIKKVYDTYYKVHTLEEMYQTFKAVLENGEDINASIRHKALIEAGLVNTNSGGRIINHLIDEIRSKRNGGTL